MTPPNDAINVEFRGPVKLPSDVLQATPVAFISFTGTDHLECSYNYTTHCELITFCCTNVSKKKPGYIDF